MATPSSQPILPEGIATRIARPARRFMAMEAASGVVLVSATLLALVLANSPWAQHYEALINLPISVGVGNWTASHTAQDWINEGLMALFFFVIGLEVKREVVSGELGEARNLQLPLLAAAGGMVVPAALYVWVAGSGDANIRGWGVPMATDIAFALGILALLGSRVPSGLRMLLLSIAIVDDLGAVVVIAIFYSAGISINALLLAAVCLVVIAGMRMAHIYWTPAYALVAVVAWFAMAESGVHATVLGVAVGLLMPATPLVGVGRLQQLAEALIGADTSGDPFDNQQAADPATTRRAQIAASNVVAFTDRLLHQLHPWTSFLILPIFAFANAGVSLKGAANEVTSPVAIGIVAGLVIGKLIGISAGVGIATRLGARLPIDVTRMHVAGLAALAGIGFTMALFVADLAFHGTVELEQAKLGVMAGSILAAAIGCSLLLMASRTQRNAARSTAR